jgi:hypothetical protein
MTNRDFGNNTLPLGPEVGLNISTSSYRSTAENDSQRIQEAQQSSINPVSVSVPVPFQPQPYPHPMENFYNQPGPSTKNQYYYSSLPRWPVETHTYTGDERIPWGQEDLLKLEAYAKDMYGNRHGAGNGESVENGKKRREEFGYDREVEEVSWAGNVS